MNHIKKAEIIFPEVSDHKLHVKRMITVETGKQQTTTGWQTFCEAYTITTLGMIGFAILVIAVH